MGIPREAAENAKLVSGRGDPIGVNLSTAVILSAAKDLCPRRIRPFAALRVTGDGRLPESVALENLLKLTLMGATLAVALFAVDAMLPISYDSIVLCCLPSSNRTSMGVGYEPG